ncbi:MAG: DUF4397 domain-containing protein, partial [Chitinophagaceae bacterium]|nr:DUF4397 domain-containing protein [Chitinophagaceae bacterium]
MKYILIKLGTCFLLFFTSCKKDILEIQDACAVNVINAVVGADPIITDFDNLPFIDSFFAYTPKISYGSRVIFSRPVGEISFKAYQFADTTNVLYSLDELSKKPDLKPQGIYSLFLCGEIPTAVEGIFIEDELPSHSNTDSTVGIRFINLSPGSPSVNVFLAGAGEPEFSMLNYKGITEFKNYATTSAIAEYVFEFRDANTQEVLATYTLSGINYGTGTDQNINPYRFKNYTIMLGGLPGAQSAY